MFATLVFFLLAAAPARSQGAADQLCAAAGASSGCIDFGYQSSAPTYQRPDRIQPPTCAECDQQALEQSLATMAHPEPVVSLAGDTGMILQVDVVAANELLSAEDLALEAVLAAPALELALDVAATLFVLNVAVAIGKPFLPAGIRIPVWLNLLSFSRADASDAAQECVELLSAARAACQDPPPSTCDGSDDCMALLAKRKARLACDRAWGNLKWNGKCENGRGTDAEQRAMRENTDIVKDCGRRISNNPECCPDAIHVQKMICKNGIGVCGKENDLDDSALLQFDAGSLSTLCATGRAKKSAAAACAAARIAERDQCYEGQLDAGHEDQLNDTLQHVDTCESFLANLRRFTSCP